jgi:hypothetical protein
MALSDASLGGRPDLSFHALGFAEKHGGDGVVRPEREKS